MADVSRASVFSGIFLRPPEKERFAEWAEVAGGRCLWGRACAPLLQRLAAGVPDSVAPAMLTLVGTCLTVQAWCFCDGYWTAQPRLARWVAAVCLGVSWLCYGVGGAHARRIRSDTALLALFNSASEVVASVFLVMLSCSLYGERDLGVQWYCVQIVQLLMMLQRYWALTSQVRQTCFGLPVLPLLALGLVAVLHRLDLVASWRCLSWLVVALVALAGGRGSPRAPPALPGLVASAPAGAACVARTRSALVLILALRALSVWLQHEVRERVAPLKEDVALDGMFLAVVSSDVALSNMAGRALHPWLVAAAALAVLPLHRLVTLAMFVFYYTAVYADLANHLNEPLLRVARNVYCDGIYDLCHVGHKNAFRRAAQLGDRLLVGVVGDEDANNYKRPPIMSAAEREAEVLGCKCVSQVISNSPCWGLTEEFLKEHQIHVVAFGQEYLERYPNPDDDPYYKVPRKMGIAVPLPRTQGLSTSDLITRIQQRGTVEKKSPT